ncbi:hypothetical protein DRW03_21255 [Corallococcus sp. H22C18031201]|nr:hypothetical protein DRW03_21255 [Corallococcus sp. H22C18031201]
MTLLGHRFKQRFFLARLLQSGARGMTEYADPVAYRCRYQGSTRRVVDTNGDMAVTEGVFHTAIEVRSGDLVWRPGDDPQDPSQGKSPLRVTPHYDMRGQLDHYEVFI